jgi:hypothetical protein
MDPLLKWKREGEERERRIAREVELRNGAEQSEATATSAWQKYILDAIREQTMTAARAIGVATAEALGELDKTIHQLSRRIDKLEWENAKLGAEVAKLSLKIAQDAVDRDRERERNYAPPPIRRNELN